MVQVVQAYEAVKINTRESGLSPMAMVRQTCVHGLNLRESWLL